MKKLLILMMLAFVVGYTSGAADYTEMEQEVVRTETVTNSEWIFPEQCQGAIAYGLGTQIPSLSAVDIYNEKARSCFDALDRDVPEYRNDNALPTTQVVVTTEEDITITDMQLENAFEDCLDEDWSEIYCEDHYEDWLD